MCTNSYFLSLETFQNFKFQPYRASTWLNWRPSSPALTSHVHRSRRFSACWSQWLLFCCFSKCITAPVPLRREALQEAPRWRVCVRVWCPIMRACVRLWPCLLQRPLSNRHKAFLVNDSPTYPYGSPLARRGRTATPSANKLPARRGSASGPK